VAIGCHPVLSGADVWGLFNRPFLKAGFKVRLFARMYGLSPRKSSTAFEEISDPPKLKKTRTVIGRSELLSHRPKSKSK